MVPVRAELALFNLLLKLFQSVEDKYPSVDVVAWEMLTAGVVVSFETEMGPEPLTLVTVPLGRFDHAKVPLPLVVRA